MNLKNRRIVRFALVSITLQEELEGRIDLHRTGLVTFFRFQFNIINILVLMCIVRKGHAIFRNSGHQIHLRCFKSQVLQINNHFRFFFVFFNLLIYLFIFVLEEKW